MTLLLPPLAEVVVVAERHLRPLGNRWIHTQAVAGRPLGVEAMTMSEPVDVQYPVGSWRVRTCVELDALLDAIAEVCAACWVELVGAGGTRVLGVALGRAGVSSLRFTDRTTGERVSCLGAGMPVSEEVFDDRGLPARLDTESAVTDRQARAAVRDFFETGGRPSCLRWHMRGHERYGTL